MGLEVDTFEQEAWIGVVPFWMDGVRNRLFGAYTVPVPTTETFSELNLRTYVRSSRTGKQGVYFFSLDCTSPLAVLGARLFFHLPYFCASMHRTRQGDLTHYKSNRQLASSAPCFDASFGPVGQVELSHPGSLAAFLTERYCLFTSQRGASASRRDTPSPMASPSGSG